MTIDNVLAAVAVKDFEKALTWYERLLDRPSDPVPAEMKGLAEWRLAKGGCLQLFKDDGGRAGKSSVTLVVGDLAAHVAALEATGVRIGKTSESPYVKTAIVNDDEGNQIVLALRSVTPSRNDGAARASSIQPQLKPKGPSQ